MKPRSTLALWLRRLDFLPPWAAWALGLGGGALAGAAFVGTAPGTVASSVLKAPEDFPAERFPHTILLPRIWALRQNLTAYDAAYVALAEALDATLLITRDSRIRRAPGHFARVEIF